jgi:ankyrin repeat protein
MQIACAFYHLLHINLSKQGHLSCADELLGGVAAAEVGCKDSTGATPLHDAAGHGHVDCVALLLARGASVTATQAYGQTALHDAAGMGHVKVLELLLAKGSDKDAKDDTLSTPLHLAARWVNCARWSSCSGSSSASAWWRKGLC